jgi:alpha-L-rhamnosidase
MNSLCHIALGTVATWLHATVGGLARDPDVVGWWRARVAPEPGGGVTWARTSYESRIGRYAVEWSLDDGVLAVSVEVPVGGEASVRLPGTLVEPVDGLVSEAGLTTGLLGPGGWRVAVRQTIAVGGSTAPPAGRK